MSQRLPVSAADRADEVSVPAGVDDGQVLRLASKGDASQLSGVVYNLGA
jgi:DnaJ-class molecular chaperone